MEHVLIVEDDARTATFVIGALQQAGYATTRCRDGEEGLAALLHGDCDVAVMDVMLPKRDGLSVVREARAAGRKMPILILSARGSVDAKVQGLEVGADDYLAKPFSVVELIARIQALLRRSRDQEQTLELRYEDLVMDLATHRVTRGGEVVDLQPLEYKLLEYLLRNRRRIVSRNMILESVWGYSFDPRTNVVESRISRLREKINRPGWHQLIKTVRGFGYALD
jgi:DNA-binding response OmpR family regulator